MPPTHYRHVYDYHVSFDALDRHEPCYCDGCDYVFPFEHGLAIESCVLDPGAPSPACRCPRCEALAYPEDI